MWSLLPAFIPVLFALSQLSRAVPFEEYIFAPASRDVKPRSVFRWDGSISNPEGVLKEDGQSSTTISGANSSVTYDFGMNVAGRIRFTVGGNVSEWGEVLGLTYSESSLWVNSWESDGTGNNVNDLPYNFNVTKPGEYVVPQEFLRGGFKYLTLVLQTPGSIELTDLRLNYTAMPHFKNMRAYTGYFHSDDNLLNRIWYAGAYTNQLCTITPSEGNALAEVGIVPPGESTAPPGVSYLNTTLTNGTSTVVDGAKRDRLVWPGDYSVAFPAIAVSTYDLISIANGLDSLFLAQNAAGQLPYAGFPFPSPQGTFSFTYHMYNLVAVANHYLWSGDIEYLRGKWDGWKRGIAWSLGTIDETGLMNVTSSADWLRFYLGGHAIEANAILYGTLDMGLTLAKALNDTSVVKDYTNNMTTIKAAANVLLWDGNAGMYRDNDTSTLLPQDGNVWAIRSGLVQNDSQALSISSYLQSRWTAFGSVAVEAADAISPFITSMELDAHFTLNNSAAGLELIRRQWGYMMDDPRMTNSTFIEGYSADGTLHYPPYSNDARISYAHGWATGPTYTLTTYAAGIRVTGPAGKTWMIWPQPGDLTNVEAGLTTNLGKFSVAYTFENNTFSLQFETPPGSWGSLVIPTFKDRNMTGVTYTIERMDGGDGQVRGGSKWQDGLFVGEDGLEGGNYSVVARYTS